MTATLLFLFLLLPCIVESSFSNSWHEGNIEIEFDLSSLFPKLLKPFLRELYLNRGEIVWKATIVMLLTSDFTTNYLEGSLQWLNENRPELNATALYERSVGEKSLFDEITKTKLKEFTSELIEADVLNTQYEVGRLLFNYLRYRQSFGKARMIIRRCYPELEAFAQVSEIRDFYYRYRDFHPNNLFMMAEFIELINWLLEQGQLPMIRMKSSYLEAIGKQAK